MTISPKTLGPALAMALLAGCATSRQPQSTADLETALEAKKAQTASDLAYARTHHGTYPEDLRGVQCDTPSPADSAVAGAAANSAGGLLGRYLPGGASGALSGAASGLTGKFSGAGGYLKGKLGEATDAVGITDTAAHAALCDRIANLQKALAPK